MTRLCFSSIALLIAVNSVICGDKFDNVRKMELTENEKYMIVDNKLATKLNCHKGDLRDFHYNSRNQLWGEAGGLIEIELDITLLCLGDAGGNYVQPACKYLVELSNIRGNPVPYQKNETRSKRDVNESNRPLRRSKRGFTDWVSNAWSKVKRFFRRIFNMDEPETRRESSDVVVFTDKPTTTTERIYYEANEVEVFDPSKYQSIYEKPYEFIQLIDGSIPEIRFATNDTDESVRNFKRHLTEIFSTNLILDKKSKEEETPMGKHKTRYTHLKNGAPSTTTPRPSASLTESDQLTVVKKVKKGDIVNLTPMKGYKIPGLNNADNMDLDTIQIQKFLEGSLVSAEGELNMAVNQIDKKRRRRSLDDDTFSHLAVKSSFTLELKRRTKRSLADGQLNIRNIEKEFHFVPSTLASSATSEIFEENRLENLREKLSEFVLNLENLITEGARTNLSYLLEALELEVKLGNKMLVHKVPQTITHQLVKKVCLSGSKKQCTVGVLILSTIGGPKHEILLLDLIDLLSTHSEIPNRISVLNHIAASVSSLPFSTSGFLSSILDRITNPKMAPSVAGVIANSLSFLLTKNDVPEKVKAYCFDRLVAFVHDRATKCPVEDELVFQLIEALGVGLTYQKEIIAVAQKCYHVHVYQLRVLKALRHSLNSSVTHNWIEKCLDDASCEFKVKVAEFLTSSVLKQRLVGVEEWPAVGFNNIDLKLKDTLLNSNKSELCNKADIYKYFEHKDDPKADAVVASYEKSQLSNRKRRASSIWDDQLCDSWKNHKKSSESPVDGFEEEGEMYNRWSHCSGKRKLGRDMANAVFDGGMFAGVKYPTNPPEYKVEATMSGEANFLGKDFELGRVGFSVNERKSKTYVELLGRNLLDLKGQNCTEDEYIYRPAQHVPLFSLNIWIVQVSFGIHLGVEAAVQFKCPRSDDSQKYIFQPTTIARVGGEAAGRVLMLRAGVNIGGNFNYHMKADLSPYPEACFSAKHGYEPMSISLESWYQFYKPLTINDWTKRIRWRPNFLSWDVIDANENDWLKTYCVLSEDEITNSTTTTTVAP